MFYLTVEHWLSIVYLHTGALMGAGLQALGVYEYNTNLPPSEQARRLVFQTLNSQQFGDLSGHLFSLKYSYNNKH